MHRVRSLQSSLLRFMLKPELLAPIGAYYDNPVRGDPACAAHGCACGVCTRLHTGVRMRGAAARPGAFRSAPAARRPCVGHPCPVRALANGSLRRHAPPHASSALLHRHTPPVRSAGGAARAVARAGGAACFHPPPEEAVRRDAAGGNRGGCMARPWPRRRGCTARPCFSSWKQLEAIGVGLGAAEGIYGFWRRASAVH